MVGVLDHADEPGDGRDARRRGQPLGCDLVSHRFDSVGIRADEGDPLGGERAGEGRVLGQETEAGMHRVRPDPFGRRDDGLDPEIGLGRGRGPDQDRLVGHLDGQGVRVRFGIDLRHRHAEPPRGAGDADRDLSPVGDQDLGKHADQSGMLSCLRGGLLRLLFSKVRSARMIRRRVPCGRITSSI